MPRLLPALMVILLTVATPGSNPSPATAATLTFTVNSTADAPDVHPGDGVCADAAGKCTLRAAIQEADAQSRGSRITIDVPAGTYGLTLGTLQLTANSITISGALSSTTTINGHNASTVMAISSAVRASISKVTITGGNAGAAGYGGGIYNTGQLTLTGITVRGNTAAAGGGVANSGGRLTVMRSLISTNTATGYGGGGIQNGGLHNVAGTVAVLNSVVTGNKPGGGDGAGILNGQNGHPAGAETGAVAVHGYCAYVVRCAAATRMHLAAASAAAPLPLTLTVVGSSISNNGPANAGGGIANDGGTASVRSSVLSGNTTTGFGGGISSYGTLTVAGSTLSQNVAQSLARGGGIEAFYGSITGSTTVISSTLNQNTATSYGGAIDVSGAPVAFTLSQSTLSGNTATDGGGAIENEGSSMTLLNSTLSGNTSTLGGGGIETYQCGSGTLSYVTLATNSSALALSCPDVVLTGTIVANSTAGADCTGALPAESAGFNLDSGASCGFTRTTDLSNTDPLLGPLTDNGGPTQTMALLSGSPAIDHGGSHATGYPATDERGMPRPDELKDSGACDMGAYESQGVG